MKNFSTLSQLLSFQGKNFNNLRAFNFYEKGQSKSFSNQEFLQKTFHFACGLKEIGFEKGQTLAIFSYQNPIWMIADFGTILAGGISVPIFHNISEENLLFEIKDADVKYFFVDQSHFVQNKLDAKKIITYGFDMSNPDDSLVSFENLLLLGKTAADKKKYDFDEMVNAVKEDDIATIIYTSGSTGTPKGVEITHKNLVSQIHGARELFPLNCKNDIALSFLPLAHIFEKMVSLLYVSQGVSVYFIDDIKALGAFLQEVKPTIMTTVPRMLEKVFLRIKERVRHSSLIKRFLAELAIKRALRKDPEAKKNIIDHIFDALVYKKFRQSMGGKLDLVICGGAALSNDMERFYNNIGVKLFCGYGLTETSPVLAVNHQNAHRLFTVGKAFPQVSLKISDEGELLTKGDNIMRGYHNNPEKTAEVMLDGWFKTGDLAKIDEEGFVKIIGRKKELFKNSNGKYIAPVPIEQKLIEKLEFLLGAIIIAEGRKFTSVVLFPEFEILEKFKKRFDCEKISDEEFLSSEKLQNFVSEKIEGINQNLDNWEKIRKFYIAKEGLSIESGEITPSMKLKRNVLEERYKDVISDFYEE